MRIGIPSTTQPISTDGIVSSVWFTFLQNVWRAIRGDLNLSLGGMLNVNTTSVSNATTLETNLITYSLGANSLINQGDTLEIDAWGTYAANASSKTVKLVFGSQTILTTLTTGAIAVNNGSWSINAKIIMKTSTTQEIISRIISSNNSVLDSATRTAGTQNLGTALTIKCTGTGVNSGDIIQYALKINLTPNT